MVITSLIPIDCQAAIEFRDIGIGFRMIEAVAGAVAANDDSFRHAVNNI
jgi:hypothetical protein